MTGNVRKFIKDEIYKYLLYKRLYRVVPDELIAEERFIRNEPLDNGTYNGGGLMIDKGYINMMRMEYISTRIMEGMRLTKKEKIEYRILKQNEV